MEIRSIVGFPQIFNPALATDAKRRWILALERLAFPSAGGSLTIAPLLLSDLFRTSDLLTSMSDVRLTGNEKIDSRETFRLEGKLWRAQPIKLWIDKTQYVIVKISRKVLFGDSEVESTVHFKPKLNTDIPPEVLQFKMPDSPGGCSPAGKSGGVIAFDSAGPDATPPKLRVEPRFKPKRTRAPR